MALLDLQQRPGYLGPSILSGTRCRNYIGAAVIKTGIGSQFVLRNASAEIEFNTTIEDVGGWFDNSTASLRKRLTVPEGVSRARVHMGLRMAPTGTSVPGDQGFMNLFQNGSAVAGMGRLNVAMTTVNFWRSTTLPIPVVPGDFFEVQFQYFASVTSPSIEILNTNETVFAVEAVTC